MSSGARQTGNFKTPERSFTQDDVERLARRALQRAHGDPDKAGRYAASMADRYESTKWEQVMNYIRDRKIS